MLISCPKCGFSQPQDRFCAKCGVDMENFKTAQPPPSKSFFSNGIFQIISLLVLVAGVFYFIRENNRENLANRVQFLKGGPVIATRAIPSETTPAATVAATAAAQPSVPTEAAPPPPTPPPPATTISNAMPVLSNEAVKIHVYYAEVDHTTMETLRQESHSTGQFTEFGDFKAGALPANRKPTRERGVRILEKIERKLDAQHLTEQWFAGSKTSEREIGITTMISIDSPAGKALRGEIELVRSFRESEDPSQMPVKRSYPTTSFELNSGMSWMITLNLPQNPQVSAHEEGENNDAEGILRIFQSPQYKSKQTEFTLFIEFDTPASLNAGKTHEQNGN